MEYNYLVTYKARKNKEDKEINSTIPIILDCPIYQPEVLMHVNEAIKDLHRYDDIMLMNVEVLNLENEEMKAFFYGKITKQFTFPVKELGR